MGLLVTALDFSTQKLGRRTRGEGFPWRRCLLDAWVVFASNFGVDMSKGGQRSYSGHFPLRVLLLSTFIVGSVTFIGYRASLTSELSVRTLEMPFAKMEDLVHSDFKY